MAKARDLFNACKTGKLDTVKKLVESKKVFPSAAVDDRCNDFTALHHAAANGHCSIVQYLVDKDCEMNAMDMHRKTPLHYAAENGHLPVVKFLVGKTECSFDLKSSVGKTPMKYASDNGHGEIAAFLSEHARKKRKEEEAAFNPKTPGKTIELSEANHSSLTNQLRTHSAKWRTIGTNLGFHPGELDNIQSNPTLSTNAPSSYLEKLLADWLQWAPGDTRDSKSTATLGALQAAVRRAGLGRVAAQLTE